MKLLFDSHTFIWWHSQRAKLSARVLALCEDPDNEVLLSLVSIWEIQIKHQLGKLDLSMPLAEIVAHQQSENQIDLLPINLQHILALDNLPQHHRDPFDRLLIAQAQYENIPILSQDTIFTRYQIQIIW